MPKTLFYQAPNVLPHPLNIKSPKVVKGHYKWDRTPKDNMDLYAFRRIAKLLPGISSPVKRKIQKYRRLQKQKLDIPNTVVVNRRIADSFVQTEESVANEESNTREVPERNNLKETCSGSSKYVCGDCKFPHYRCNCEESTTE